MNQFNNEIKRLLDTKTKLTPYDLDILWSLYYATGDMKYPNRVKMVADTITPSDFPTCSAAKWSYNSHINQGLLDL